MREFNLEEAKAGKPVCTRDGRNARIICFDVKHEYHPIIALIESEGKEFSASFGKDGRFDDVHYKDSCLDLFMVSKKHEGWANILVGSACKSNLNRYFSGIFSTKEEAQRYNNTDNIVDCVKIEWEE